MTTIQEHTALRQRMQHALGAGYALGEELAGGGMSRVFAARDLTLNRDIVVKTLPPELAGDISVERFKREIHFAASLQHPHIVPVHAAGAVDGLPYYTMPRVEGESLRHRLGRVQRFSIIEALSVVRDIGRALAYAHRRGLVHRDIKPENVLIADGMAVVTDFGIAKAVAASRVDDHTDHVGPMLDTPTGLTATGTSMGTPNYMAPEQAAGDSRMDHRVDLYSLGVVAYELLCGTAPFADRSRREQLAAQLVERPRSIAELRLDIPPTVSRLVMQCLEKEPDARPTSAEEIVRELDTALTGAPPVEAVGDDPTVIRKVFAWYAVAFVAATALAWGAMSWIGLPDWVLPGTIVIMALGLPLVAVTALTRYAAFQSTTGMLRSASSGGWLFTPTDRTLRVAQALTWKRIATGGGASLGGFAILVAGFMATRAAGIGPAATLLTSGQIVRHQSVLITDFASEPRDSSIARMAAEAVNIGLRESNVVQVLAPDNIADALRRMRRDPGTRLTLDVARQLAVREGVSLIVTGDIARDGERLVIGVRLVASDSGNLLATQQATAVGATDILTAADRLTRTLRSRIGESLKRVRATPELAKVTTPSLEALDLYTQALRALEFEGDNVRAKELLKRTLELDSTFALAWRKYATTLPWGAENVAAVTAAFRHRFNTTEVEQLEIEAHYTWCCIYDRPRFIAVHDALARLTGVPHANHAWSLLVLRQFARSESLYRELFRRKADGGFQPYLGLFWALMNQGKHAAADSAGRVARTRFPTVTQIRFWTTELKCGMRQFVACEAGLDSVLKINPQHQNATKTLSELALMRGQLSRWDQLAREVERLRAPPPVTFCCPLRIETPRLSPSEEMQHLGRSIWTDLAIRQRPTTAIARLDSLPRPVNAYVAHRYALAGQTDSARAIVARLDALVPDSTAGWAGQEAYVSSVGQGGWRLKQAKAAIALREGRTRDAIQLYRDSDLHPADGMSVYPCVACAQLDLAETFDRGMEPDSAIVFYERFLSTPHYVPNTQPPWTSRGGMRWWNLVNKAWVHERLGELYQERGDRASAVRHYTEFVELWQDADPELQPRVQEARARLARLRSS